MSLDPFDQQSGERSRSRKHRKRASTLLVGAVLLSSIAVFMWYSGRVTLPAEPTRADIVFVIDATGSMADEIADVKSSLMAIGNRLANKKPQPDVRFGAVFYRDVTDAEITRVVPLSQDLSAVRAAIMDVQADGGGDWPEHVGIGLHKALEMDWSHSKAGGVRLIYLVGDAPPQSYEDGFDVGSALSIAKDLGVKIHVIGCSGLEHGEEAMRVISDATGGSFSHFERKHHAQHSGSGASSPRAEDRRRSAMSPRSDHIDGPVIGIDLGTSNSVVGIYKNGRVEIIPNDDGDRITQSFVVFNGEGALVGDITAAALANTSNIIFDVKRLIGQQYNSTSVQHNLALLSYRVVEKEGKPVIVAQRAGETRHMTPEEVTAIVLRKMKGVAEKYIGKEVTRAVITVPAYFSDSQRQSTKDAGTIAGLQVLRIINEPTAAAIAYGLDKKAEQNIIVYDLGGGTLDVSLLRIDNGVVEVVATHGNSHLGGRDFDDRVIHDLLETAQKRHGLNISGDRALWKLRAAAVKAKHTLSSTPTVRIDIEELYEGHDFSAEFTRSRFEMLNSDLFKETLNALQKVLDESGLRKDQIDEIVLTGGSTRIPKIQNLVKEFFGGKEPYRGINPDEAVAYGAAVQAGLLNDEGGSDLLLLDVTPLTLGLAGSSGEMVELISRNTVIPTKRSQMVSTEKDNQPTITIRVYEGERFIARDNHFLAELNISVPPAPRGLPQVEVIFEIDSNGILNIAAEDKHSGKSEKTTVSNDKGRLTEEQIEGMIRDAELYAAEDGEHAFRIKGNATKESCGDKWFPCGVVDPVIEEADGGLGRLSAMMLDSMNDEL